MRIVKLTRYSVFRYIDMPEPAQQNPCWMSKCPSCAQTIATPSMFNLQGWAEFVCPHCRARLEARPPRSTMLAATMPFVFGLGLAGRVFEAVAVIFAIGTFTAFLLEATHPQLRFKKPLPVPAIRLNIAGE